MKRALVAVLFGCMVFGFTSVASAANDNSIAGIALHISPLVTKNQCTDPGLAGLTAGTLQTEVFPAACDGLTGYTVYMLVCNGSDRDPGFDDVGVGVAGMEFGLAYGPELSVGGVGYCADLSFPNPSFPNSGTGTVITWDATLNCQDVPSEPFVPQTVIAVGGYVEVYANNPGQLIVTPRPASGAAKVADCNTAETVVDAARLGVAGFCDVGHNPCDLSTPVEDATWGSIKKQFGN